MEDRQEGSTGQGTAGVTEPAEVRVSQRSSKIRYAIRDILALADEARAAGRQLLALNIGDPLAFDFCTPRHVIEATYRAMLDGHNGYAPSAGLPEAIEAIRNEALGFGVQNIQDVFVTSGVSEGIDIAFAALLDPGENILIPSPGYPLFESTLAKLGCEAIRYPLDEENDWQPDVAEMARLINSRTRGVVVINPNNPTGAVCRREILQDIAELTARHGLVTFADEIYRKLILDPVEHVPLALLGPEQPMITFNALSKAYLVPGFRIGWGILTGEQRAVAAYREAIAKLLRVRLCANHPAQFAIKPALEGDQSHIAEMIGKLRRRRDLTVSLLNEAGNIHCFSPQAAFYAFPRLEISGTDQEFVAGLIREAGVIVVPGTGFGQKPGTRHFRIVFLPPEDELGKALHRITEFAGRWPH